MSPAQVGTDIAVLPRNFKGAAVKRSALRAHAMFLRRQAARWEPWQTTSRCETYDRSFQVRAPGVVHGT